MITIGVIILIIGLFEWLIIPLTIPTMTTLASHWSFVITIVGIGIIYEGYARNKKIKKQT